ncbi:MAG TPA: sigma-54 dependent transcriptional regulator, partial [Thermodesulfobacteriota bacterium]|nr:sigma-54 dependent transcriptional regulator [Thermodesulfobacteriota bacterium]
MHKILVIDDDQAILNYLGVFLTQSGKYEVDCLNESKRVMDVLAEFKPEMILLDMDMPDVTGLDILNMLAEKADAPEVLILSGVEDIELAVKAIKLGAYDYLTKPVDRDKLLISLDRMIERRMLKMRVRELSVSNESGVAEEPFSKIITCSSQMQKILNYVEKIAPTDNPVLIWGESGTGKELIARAMHKLSKRRDKPFVAVNASVFASELFASEFFGHAKGAFTGAVSDKTGILEKSDKGTLFLDEIGDLSLSIQVKLLRVLQEGEFFPVGSTKSVRVDVRLITATNKDLQEEIQRGNFRKDLFYRLNVSSIYLPPLRKREGDIPLLAQYFLDKYAQVHKKKLNSISEDVIGLFKRYRYPGNVRELENIINSAVLLESGKELTRRSLPQY